MPQRTERMKRVSVLMAHSVLGIFSQNSYKEKERGINRKGEVKLSLFAGGRSLLLENPHDSTKTLRTHKQIRQGSRELKKSLAFPCTSNELTETEMKENNHHHYSKQNKTRNKPN